MNDLEITTQSPEIDPETLTDNKNNTEVTTMNEELNANPETTYSEDTENNEVTEPVSDTDNQEPTDNLTEDENTENLKQEDSSDDEKPKRTRKPKSKATDDTTDDKVESADSNEAESTDILTKDIKASVMTDADRVKRNATRRRERVRKLRMEAPLDEEGRPIMDGDGTFDPILAEVFQKKNNREIVGGYIDQVKMGRNGGEGWTEVMYNDFRVLIPFSEMDIAIEDRRDEAKEVHASRLGKAISNMIGSRIEFVIVSVEREERLAAGSRLVANKLRQQGILNAKDREGNYLLYTGRQVRANVLSVHPLFAFVDVYGMRVRLRAADIKADYVADVNDELENGMSIAVFITHIARNDKGEITEMFISMRDDKHEKKKLQNAAVAMKSDDICRGRVSSRSKDAIFITLSNGLQAFAYVSNGLQGRKIPNIGDNISLRVTRVTENKRNGNPLILGRIIRNINYVAK